MAKSINIRRKSDLKVHKYAKIWHFIILCLIMSPLSDCRHHIKISGGQTNSTKSLPRGNRGYLALKNGLRNQN